MKEFILCIKSINKLSKIYIKAGSIFVFTIFFLAAFCSVAMGKFGNYDYLLFLKGELLYCGREMLGAIYVPALILEIISIAEKYSI